MNLRTRVKIFLSPFLGILNIKDAEHLISVLEDENSGVYQLSCGAELRSNKRKTNEDPIRAVVQCAGCNSRNNCRGIAASVDGVRMIDDKCTTTRYVVNVIVDWNKKQRERKIKEIKHE